MSRLLALDLGGTSLRAGVFERGSAATVQACLQVAAPSSLADFVVVVRTLTDRHGPFEAAGIAVPGLIEGVRCRWVPNLPWLDGIDLGDVIQVPLAVGNDAQFALLAEARHGAAREVEDVVLLAIGTGIGSAVMAGGRIVRGAGGGACSFGWACADMADLGHPSDGWLERQAAGRALNALAQKIGLLDGRSLIAAARSGHQDANAMVAAAGCAIGTALVGVVGLLDPKAVLITGGVSEALDVLGPPLRAALHRHLPLNLQGIDIRSGDFGPRAGLVGAATGAEAGSAWWILQ